MKKSTLNMGVKKFDYIKNFIPVCFEPGFMGVFLIRVLMNPVLKDASNEVLQSYFQPISWEWMLNDRIDRYLNHTPPFHGSYSNDIQRVLSAKGLSQHEIFLSTIHILLQIGHDSFTKEALIKTKITEFSGFKEKLSDEQILDLYHNDAYKDKHQDYPYIKNHIFDYVRNCFPINFHKTVYASFPKNKEWLTQVMLFHKHYWNRFIVNNPWTFQNLIGTGKTKWMLSHRLQTYLNTGDIHYMDKIGSENFPDHYLNIWNKIYPNKRNFVVIDMYDLIMNKNVNQLLAVHDDFPIDQSLMSLLDLAENHIRFICNLFDLNPDYNLDLKYDHDKKILLTDKLTHAIKTVHDYYEKDFLELIPNLYDTYPINEIQMIFKV